MKIGIMQPYFFPYIGYWQLMNVVDKYVIYDDIQYIKGGWINRNRILMNGEPKTINLVMSGASPNKLISEVGAPNDKINKSKLLKTITHSYMKAPFFEDVYPLVEEIVLCDKEVLSLYLENLIRKIAEYLDMNTQFILSSDIGKDNSLKGQDKVIEICKKLDASEYYNAIGGKELYLSEAFQAEGINLQFLRTDSITYTQFNNEFQPNLSIIDLMMFNSKEEVKRMLELYTLE